MKKAIAKARILTVLMAAAILFPGSAGAKPVQWTVEEGGNGHWYDAVAHQATWKDAKIDAEKLRWKNMSGHLATLTSPAESAFVWARFPYDQAWLGGYQADKTAEPAGNWRWVTGEPWDYTNWTEGEPNDQDGIEEYLEFWGDGTWNDQHHRVRERYIIEYEPSGAAAGGVKGK